MKVTEMCIPGVFLLEPQRFADVRGWLMETWRADRYAAAGVPGPFVQDNLVLSAKGVLRGLHAQHPFDQGKLVQVYQGQVFDVAVDVRLGSPTFAQWVGVVLDAERPTQFYVPPGFLHGYYVLSDQAMLGYKCTELYHPETELAIRWDDPEIGIDWPLAGEPALSGKDQEAGFLGACPRKRLAVYPG